MDVKEVYDSVRREVLYNILTEFGIAMKLVRLIKMCFKQTYSKFHIHKNLSDAFPSQKDMMQGDVLLPLLFKFPFKYAIKKVKKTGGTGTEWGTSAPGLS
jgi:hypothetical protein